MGPNFGAVRSLGYPINFMAQIIGDKHISARIKFYAVPYASSGKCVEYFSFPFFVYDPFIALCLKINGKYVLIDINARPLDAFGKGKFRGKVRALLRITATAGKGKKGNEGN